MMFWIQFIQVLYMQVLLQYDYKKFNMIYKKATEIIIMDVTEFQIYKLSELSY